MSSSVTLDPIKLYYWPAPNFGDQLSHRIVEFVSGRDVVHARPKQAEMFALGSLVHVIAKHWTDRKRPKGPILWGTGTLNPIFRRDFMENVRIRLLRGPLSAAFLRLKMKEFGDPGLLAPQALGPAEAREDRVAVLPHHSQMDDPDIHAMVAKDARLHLIDVRQSPEIVCAEIARSAHVVAASLHGLIVADAYGVASTWMDPGTQSFMKYHDYFASVGRFELAPVEIDAVPDLAARAATGPLPYGDAIEAARDALIRHFPEEYRAHAPQETLA